MYYKIHTNIPYYNTIQMIITHKAKELQYFVKLKYTFKIYNLYLKQKINYKLYVLLFCSQFYSFVLLICIIHNLINIECIF